MDGQRRATALLDDSFAAREGDKYSLRSSSKRATNSTSPFRAQQSGKKPHKNSRTSRNEEKTSPARGSEEAHQSPLKQSNSMLELPSVGKNPFMSYFDERGGAEEVGEFTTVNQELRLRLDMVQDENNELEKKLR